MKHLDQITTILVTLFALALSSGCQDRGRLEAFLQTPRSPVSGTEYIVYPPDVISISSVRVEEINESTVSRSEFDPTGRLYCLF